MRGDVLVALLVTRVLGHKVQVLSADDDGSGHLGRDHLAGQDTATDRDETGPGALLVCWGPKGWDREERVSESALGRESVMRDQQLVEARSS